MRQGFRLLGSRLLLALAALVAFAPGGGVLVTAASSATTLEFVGQAGGATDAVAVEGNRAYLGVGPRLVVMDIADPAHPALLGQSPVLGGIVHDIVLADGHAYVAAGRTIHLVSVIDPANLFSRGAITLPDEARSLA